LRTSNYFCIFRLAKFFKSNR